jgi:hypothetical protein
MISEQRRAANERYAKWYQRTHKPIKHICLNCGKEFLGRKNKIFCDRYCLSIYWGEKRRRSAKSKPALEKVITIAEVRAAEQQELPTMEAPKLITRPDEGPKCACGNVLYFYEHGKCLPCVRKSIIAQREGRVMLSDARNLSYYHAAAIAATD